LGQGIKQVGDKMLKSSQILAQFRRSIGLTQEELAEKIGVSRQTIAMWEIDKRLPTDNVAILTARFLDIDEEELLSLLQHERLRIRVQRLQDQYDATIIITEASNYGGMMMNNPEYTAHQTQQGVHFAVTHIYKSIGFEYPEKLLESKEGKVSFDAPFEALHPEECLIIKMVVQSEDETFIPNWHYVSYCEIVDDLGNHFWPIAMGMHASLPPEAEGGGVVRGFARYRYVPEARAITLRQTIANGREEDCDFVVFEDVKLTERGISKPVAKRRGEAAFHINNLALTYDGVRLTEIREPHNPQKNSQISQIHIRFQERGNPKYVGINNFTDNLGNEYKTRGWSWNFEDKTQEGFIIKGLASEAESISFKYLLAKTGLDFQFSDLPIPS